MVVTFPAAIMIPYASPVPLALLSAFISDSGGSCPKVLSPKSSVREL